MTFDQFITTWNGRGIDFDGYYGDQCMDLMHQYCVEVLGLSDSRILAAPTAKDVWLTSVFGKEKFEAISNTPTGVPQKGDIILWGTGIGPAGHVAIFIEGDANKFKSFDQNFPTGSKCHIQDHTYIGVLGWLRYKGTTDITYKGYDLTNRDSMKIAVDILVKVLAGEFVNKLEYDKLKIELEKAKETNNNLNQQITDRKNDIITLNGRISTLETQVLDLTQRSDILDAQAKRIPDLEKQVNEYEAHREGCSETTKTYNRTVAQLRSDNEYLKKHLLRSLLKIIIKKLGLN